MHIGVFGGSFNPVHKQHMRMAGSVLEQTDVEEVWFIPVFNPVHKPGRDLVSYEDRRKMLELAIGEESSPHNNSSAGSRMILCDMERDLGGPSFTINTLRSLKRSFPQNIFSLVIGGDSLCDLPGWRNIDELVGMCRFLVISRPGFIKKCPVEKARITWVDTNVSAISATEIRAGLADGETCFKQLHNSVMFHIWRNNLYSSMEPDYVRALDLIMPHYKILPEGLAAHMNSVAEYAAILATDLGEDPRKAYVGGLAHDLFRVADSEVILAMARFSPKPLNDLQRSVPMLAHGAAAAGFLTRNGVELPDDLLAAIHDHTFPQADSPLMTRIMAVADALDPSRSDADRDEIRCKSSSFAELYARVLILKMHHCR